MIVALITKFQYFYPHFDDFIILLYAEKQLMMFNLLMVYIKPIKIKLHIEPY